MMTTLDGRLDDPGAWVTGVDDRQYEDIDRRFEAFDSVLVGRTTYDEMYAYWPGALESETGFADSNPSTNRRMARKMNDYRKYVITREKDAEHLEWTNSERVVVHSDDELCDFVRRLKSQPGRDIHLAGGATLAQEFVRLRLIDEYRFFVYPTLSNGARWFDRVDAHPPLRLITTDAYANGVVGLHYLRHDLASPEPVP
jgi:dihydrofolate reductase